MLETITKLLVSLNMIEVHGEKNLALLYTSIDTLKQVQKGLLRNKEEVEIINARTDTDSSS